MRWSRSSARRGRPAPAADRLTESRSNGVIEQQAARSTLAESGGAVDATRQFVKVEVQKLLESIRAEVAETKRESLAREVALQAATTELHQCRAELTTARALLSERDDQLRGLRVEMESCRTAERESAAAATAAAAAAAARAATPTRIGVAPPSDIEMAVARQLAALTAIVESRSVAGEVGAAAATAVAAATAAASAARYPQSTTAASSPATSAAPAARRQLATLSAASANGATSEPRAKATPKAAQAAPTPSGGGVASIELAPIAASSVLRADRARPTASPARSEHPVGRHSAATAPAPAPPPSLASDRAPAPRVAIPTLPLAIPALPLADPSRAKGLADALPRPLACAGALPSVAASGSLTSRTLNTARPRRNVRGNMTPAKTVVVGGAVTARGRLENDENRANAAEPARARDSSLRGSSGSGLVPRLTEAPTGERPQRALAVRI